MAGGNPVFDRIDKQLQQERYAGFGAPRREQGPMGGTQAATTGYAAQDAMTAEQLNDLYARQAAGPVDTGRVTLDDVIVKSLVLFAVTLASAGISWFMVDGDPGLISPLWLGGMFGTLILGFAMMFMKNIPTPLYFVYAVVQGLFLGAFSYFLDARYGGGLILTAVVATLSVFVAMYAGYATGLIKVTDKSRRMFVFMIAGYALFSIIQVVLLMTGVIDGWGFGGSGPLGIGLSLLGVGLASYSLAVDFDSIDNAVRVGAPQKYSWLLAHGLIVSVVWLYIEIARLLARLRDA
ncbi:Bax inhibitor-1/YccA family protein [Intrasporangium calvum]|uniref:Bax inhibitor-1/YccA family protein n=1 Tax=Intrasporangium calvum TaxID=53358 RepID=A0ABT5GLQ4_9MICO|nr:Bax inhibitor-1/YccA family protein [Intrasporangium calvum]MDC5698988.1 Bax inhibitor-1/YccA family protein [Intrasporangium calvum]